MKFAHLGDLHLGKSLNAYSLIEDQKYILQQILEILKKEKVDAVAICGDVYDRSVPSAEATVLLDSFLSALADNRIEVYMIAGNHDSGDRLSYASGLLDSMQIHIAGNYTGELKKYVFTDAYGTVNLYALPFVRPSTVNRWIEDEQEKATDYTEALRYVIDRAGVDPKERNVILAHQFVVGASVDERGSEELVVGGLDQVSAEVFDVFDYTALGHIHRPQIIGKKETVRYSGTPLKYSLSEKDQIKSVPIVEMKEKGNITVTPVPLKPLHEVREIRGTFAQIRYSSPNAKDREDYVHFVLEDEEVIPNAMRDLQAVYPNALSLDYASLYTLLPEQLDGVKEEQLRTPLEVFAEFYALYNGGKELSDEQREYLSEVITEIWFEEDKA